MNYSDLTIQIKAWAKQLGFADSRVTDLNLASFQTDFKQWLAHHYHGEMDYMATHQDIRFHPQKLLANAQRALLVRMDYLPPSCLSTWREQECQQYQQPQQAIVSLYARGRDYHKVLRAKLRQLIQHIQSAIPSFTGRIFTDSAPVMEVTLAQKAGLGWRGKHTLLLNRQGGSLFFLGGMLTNLPLTIDEPIANHCGQCNACIHSCPTNAIIAPYQLDARRCISYLTIELKTSIPLELRPLIQNRVYGCDDCQLYCPWNKFAQTSSQPDFAVRNGLNNIQLIELFSWSEHNFNTKLAGSPIRRIGYPQWLRNLAVGLGNALRHSQTPPHETKKIKLLLQDKLNYPSALVQEHVLWALAQAKTSAYTAT